MICFHKWHQPSGRYQACAKCNLVRTIDCAHEWETVQSVQGEYALITGVALLYILRCKHCGEVKKAKII